MTASLLFRQAMETCYGDVPLDAAIRSRRIDGVNGLSMHILEAGHQHPDQPLALLLHGFPELAFSWRKLMPLIAARGYHVIAPDQRGYGATTGWDADYDGDLAPFRLSRLVGDILALLATFPHRRVAAVVGHDFGSPVAAWCALLHPDIFGCVALLSAPFPGPPRPRPDPWPEIDAALAALQPPRKHYQRYYTTREANADMHDSAQGLGAFLRAYFHSKSHDWPHNRPHALKSWRAGDLATMPRYYVMDLDKGMAATVADMAPSSEEVERCTWLTDAELDVYVREFGRTGFQGALNWYRNTFDAAAVAELEAYNGRRIEVPACFIAGRSDWGSYQSPGALEAMSPACASFEGPHFIEEAGHWVQQEQPQRLDATLGQFLALHAS
ncbi:MAG TPA: alpha/beta hydrolase [Mycobacterium sp.]|nr:alpha/beta hydrolase [Mycobacterium sp.]